MQDTENTLNTTLRKQPQPQSKHSKNLFNNIHENMISHILTFLPLGDQIQCPQLSQKFKTAFYFISVPSQYRKVVNLNTYINYVLFCLGLERTFKNNSKYLNVILNINIADILDSNISKQLAVIAFLNHRYLITKNKNYFLSINNPTQFKANNFILTSLQFYKQLKYTLTFSSLQSPNTEENNILQNQVLDFFKSIKIHKLNGCTSVNPYIAIQKQIFNKKIECYHHCIFFTDSDYLPTGIEYFKAYPNHLSCIESEKFMPLAKYNEKSLIKIDGDFPYSIVEYPNGTNGKKIDFAMNDYDISINQLIHPNMCLENITTFSGIVMQSKEDIDTYVSYITRMPKLKHIKSIGFFSEHRCEALLFKSFLEKIGSNLNIKSIKSWGYSFKKDYDHRQGMSNFKNLSRVNEDSDNSFGYYQRFEIDNVFSTSIGNQNASVDGDVLEELILNKLRLRKEGSKFISFTGFCDDETIVDLFNNVKTPLIRDSVYTIKFVVAGWNRLNKRKINLKKGMFLEMNRCVNEKIQMLDDLEMVDQIKVQTQSDGIANINFVVRVKPVCLIYGEKINEESLKGINMVKSLKYFITSEENKDIIGEDTKVRVVICVKSDLSKMGEHNTLI